MPTSRRLRNRRLGSRLRGRLPRPILMAFSKSRPYAKIPITIDHSFHYRAGTCTLVSVADSRPMPSTNMRWRLAMPLMTVLAVLVSGCTSSPPSKTARAFPAALRAPAGHDRRSLAGAHNAARRRDHWQPLLADIIAAACGRGSALVPLDGRHRDVDDRGRLLEVPTSRPRSHRGRWRCPDQVAGADTAAAMCVTWHLRQGVRWDDGSELTSHDVCDTFDFHWLAYGALGKPARRRWPRPPAGTR